MNFIEKIHHPETENLPLDGLVCFLYFMALSFCIYHYRFWLFLA
ncbi:hypothetical protein LXL04_000138 [Taraxacum kok-saghyz]